MDETVLEGGVVVLFVLKLNDVFPSNGRIWGQRDGGNLSGLGGMQDAAGGAWYTHLGFW